MKLNCRKKQLTSIDLGYLILYYDKFNFEKHICNIALKNWSYLQILQNLAIMMQYSNYFMYLFCFALSTVHLFSALQLILILNC